MGAVESEALVGTEIAVTGMACRFPAARDLASFWRLLSEGRDAHEPIDEDELRAAGVTPALLRDPNYVRAGMPLEGMEDFDAGFFGFSPSEAALMDPQHRHFLECGWEAIEHAGWDPARFDGSIGVFAGSGMNTYLLHNLLSNPELVDRVGWFLLRHTNNDKDFLVTRLAYLLDLHGPAVNVQTACSTSLVAIHLACQSLLAEECDMALAGGVTIDVHQRRGYLHRPGEIVSEDGRCRPFDASSTGTVFGSGVGLVVLRRLEDALASGETVHAIVRGSAVNNDGLRKVGYLAPSVDGHADAVAEALEVAGVDAGSIGYVEAHGTGTAVGDPIEAEALSQAFRRSTDANGFCGLGSVKSNIGHLDTAAGVASFMKAALALEHEAIPPSLHFEQPNPLIDFESSPFFVNANLRDWPRGTSPRRAGVSSLGVGGTNAHVVLEEAPTPSPSEDESGAQLLVLSARNREALDQGSARLASHLRSHPDQSLADLAFTLQDGRRAFEHRRVVAGTSHEELAGLLEERDRQRVHDAIAPEGDRSVAFLFPGQGSQHAGMASGLYAVNPVFQEAFDDCSEIAKDVIGIDLRELLCSPELGDPAEIQLQLRETRITQPALFAVEYAVARAWQAWGIEPAAMAGHSVGEFVAACLAGVFSLESAVRLVGERGRLMQSMPSGSMLSVSLSADDAFSRIGPELAVAADNAPGLCVVSGSEEAVEALRVELEAEGCAVRALETSHAFHSPMMDPVVEEFTKHVRDESLSVPTIPIVSTATGRWLDPQEATDPDYWGRHLRRTVRFRSAVETLLGSGEHVGLEVGPGISLTSLARLHPAVPAGSIVPSLRHPQDTTPDESALLTAFGRLFGAGVPVAWERIHGGRSRRRVPAPTYSFARERHWIDEVPRTSEGAADAAPRREVDRLDFDEWFLAPAFEREAGRLADEGAFAEAQTWLLLTDERGLGQRLAEQLVERGQRVIFALPGEGFEEIGDSTFAVRPDSADDLGALLAKLTGRRRPDRILHLASVDAGGEEDAGFASLLALTGAIANAGLEALELTVVTHGALAVDGAPERPEAATLLGPCRVLPHELPGTACRLIDVESVGADADLPALATQILGELSAPEPSGSVALRGGDRLTESLARATTRDPEPPVFRSEGTYLITGGLGGVGLGLARLLAERYQAKLVLLGRTPVPPREDWDAILEGAGPLTQRPRVAAIRELEDAGAQVFVQALDVCDSQAVHEALAAARARFGGIDGVVHAAGVVDDGPIALKTLESARAVLAPKVRGTRVLAEAIEALPTDDRPDWLVLCSSVSARLGPAGQVDYAAANAFLGAFAASFRERSGVETVAVEWGPFADVGMAADAARRLGLSDPAPVPAAHRLPVAHPMLDFRVVEPDAEPESFEYRAEYGLDRWWIGEHRLRGGEALIPGTGTLELMLASYEDACGSLPQLENVAFLLPLELREGERREIRVRLTPSGTDGSLRVELASRQVEPELGREWIDHAEALARPVEEARERDVDREAIEQATADRELVAPSDGPQTKQEAHLEFGPRWRVLREMRFGGRDALATLQAPDAFAGEVAGFRAYPPLLDLATGYALPLLEGYPDCEELFIPLGYQRIVGLHPLPAHFYSHARVEEGASASSDTATFDLTLFDEAGRVCIEIEGFTVRRIAPGRRVGAESAAAASVPAIRPELALLAFGARSGIRPDEALGAFGRALGLGIPCAVVTPGDLDALREASLPEPPPQSAGGASAPVAVASTRFSDPLEARVASIWSEFLGVADMDPEDHFFDLGGHSLLGIRVMSRINQEFGTSFAAPELFDTPTVRQLAGAIREAVPDLELEEDEPEAEVEESPVEEAASEPVAQPAAATPAPEPEAAVEPPTVEATAPESPPAPGLRPVVRLGGPAAQQGPDEAPTKSLHADLSRIRQAIDAAEGVRDTYMQEHWFAKHVLARLYSPRHRKLRSVVEYLIRKLEGNNWYSVTMRKLYKRHFDIEVGDYSADCFNLGYIKRGMRIGRYCSFDRTARFETANHPTSTVGSSGIFYQPGCGFSDGFEIPRNVIEIGHDVHIGHNAVIVYPCKSIGTGAIIGTSTVVDFDVPPYAVVAGTPARIVRYRFSREKVEALMASRWWEAPLSSLESVKDEFIRPLEGRQVR